jgi:hypothetical protein
MKNILKVYFLSLSLTFVFFSAFELIIGVPEMTQVELFDNDFSKNEFALNELGDSESENGQFQYVIEPIKNGLESHLFKFFFSQVCSKLVFPASDLFLQPPESV